MENILFTFRNSFIIIVAPVMRDICLFGGEKFEVKVRSRKKNGSILTCLFSLKESVFYRSLPERRRTTWSSTSSRYTQTHTLSCFLSENHLTAVSKATVTLQLNAAQNCFLFSLISNSYLICFMTVWVWLIQFFQAIRAEVCLLYLFLFNLSCPGGLRICNIWC